MFIQLKELATKGSIRLEGQEDLTDNLPRREACSDTDRFRFGSKRVMSKARLKLTENSRSTSSNRARDAWLRWRSM